MGIAVVDTIMVEPKWRNALLHQQKQTCNQESVKVSAPWSAKFLVYVVKNPSCKVQNGPGEYGWKIRQKLLLVMALWSGRRAMPLKAGFKTVCEGQASSIEGPPCPW
jgi:hypothetical protein